MIFFIYFLNVFLVTLGMHIVVRLVGLFFSTCMVGFPCSSGIIRRLRAYPGILKGRQRPF